MVAGPFPISDLVPVGFLPVVELSWPMKWVWVKR